MSQCTVACKRLCKLRSSGCTDVVVVEAELQGRNSANQESCSRSLSKKSADPRQRAVANQRLRNLCCPHVADVLVAEIELRQG